MDWILKKLGRMMAWYLTKPQAKVAQAATSPHEKLAGSLEPGDVLLIEGNRRVSTAIKYLTQSTWSPSAL